MILAEVNRISVKTVAASDIDTRRQMHSTAYLRSRSLKASLFVNVQYRVVQLRSQASFFSAQRKLRAQFPNALLVWLFARYLLENS